ncbi:hypothetical protein ASPZODRAFT_131413 [Penicilliopsis zonata CBS 506.65]|uniref:Uncharacterized protein n=1 Tax=Penicilliopsis zonata CBS 506.65 TaxID=1073090 RepID=A0A1L9SL68_9EURO|nr:hypothetical protein ASPZODRAFT_131413 [Penicilliopsis zonata CBS 506.65]OJJ47824.1 hypothetical protein ASPZODRAFT_131413 [Penicilliopsis zonata CBS 506.65]
MDDEELPDAPPHQGDNLYPDIDEQIHYPWQGTQPSSTGGQASISSMIDPRLYKGLFDGSASRLAGSAGDDDGEGAFGGDLSDDQSYENSEQDLSSEEDFSDLAEVEEEEEEEEEEEDDGRRRRRRGTGPFSGRYGARGGKGIKRGPRKPLEPSPEFKILHSEATSAFIDGDYPRATELVKRAIQINPEMFAAHSLLSEIFLAQGQKDKALTALFNGAHTRPKDATVWAKVARLILERAGEDRQTALNDVIYCYSRVIEIDPKNFNARFQRAAIYRELGHNGRTVTEYERILKDLPHNPRALRHLAETYIDLDDVQKAVDHYNLSVKYYLTLHPEEVADFSWSDINIYVELFSYLGKHEHGLKALKTLSRWFLGRREDTMWAQFHEDDREWDADDPPRRIKTDGYIPGQWPRDTYGLGLPLELRIKLGLFRLKMGYDHKDEALHHFAWLNPEDLSEGARLYDYGDLFREVADALKEVGLFEEALRFFRPLQMTSEYADVSFFMAMGECCMRLSQLEEAENCYLTVAEHDTANIESRVQLAKLYENIGMTEQAFKYVNEAVLLGRQETRSQRRRKDTRLEMLAKEFQADGTRPEQEEEVEGVEAGAPWPATAARPVSTSVLTTAATVQPSRKRVEAPVAEGNRTEHIQFLYSKMQQLQPMIQEGSLTATEDWLDIADALLRDFRSNRAFYPLQRNMVFLGYSREAQRRAGRYRNRSFLDEMQEMAGRLQESLGNPSDEPLAAAAIPTDYHGIPFDEWLDIFLQYALLVAGQQESEEAYDTLAAASDSSIWYHSKRSTRLIHVCWFTCALRVQDEETLAHEARWFMKEYQFVTDTYRLFAMLSRLCGDPHRSLLHSSPNMKFMLRQVKAVDAALPAHLDGDNRQTTTTTTTYADENTTEEVVGLDAALLVLYGHILYSGNSFYPALNYFFRAYALDDSNPVVLLSIALCYIHQSLKRQSENRHYLIMQGLAFMHEYRRVRELPSSLPVERQEMEFNFARVWHSLGLTHLAVDGYTRALEWGGKIREDNNKGKGLWEDFSVEAAVALQGIYALNGDLLAAKAVTERWLII